MIATKKGVCEDYSRLFKTLCYYAGIDCEVIKGRGRYWDDEVSGGTNHAWNAVMIGNKWHLLDVTWAAGICDDSVKAFMKSYNDFYFLTPPGAFINTHFPDDAKWILLDETPTLHQVYNTVYTYPGFYKSKIKSIKPVERTIEITQANRKVTIELELPAGTIPKDVFLSEMPSMAFGDVEIKVVGNKVICIYEVISDEPTGLFVYYNSKPVLAYKIKMKK